MVAQVAEFAPNDVRRIADFTRAGWALSSTLLQLRREGKQAEADRLLAALKQEFPQRDLEAELKRLQREAEKPASSR